MSKLYIQKHIEISDNSIFIDKAEHFAEDKNIDFTTFIKSAYKNSGKKYSKFYKMDALSKLGFVATELLLDNIEREHLKPEEVAIIFANASSSLNTDKKYQELIADAPSPSVFVYTLPNIVIGEICIRHNIKGESLFLVQNEFDTELMHKYITSLFDEEGTKMCITGWLEMDMNAAYLASIFLVSEKETELEFNISNIKLT